MSAQVTETAMVASAGLPDELRKALAGGDGEAFERALEDVVRSREQHVFRALGHLARELHGAMGKLGHDLAHEGVPNSVENALEQLDEVLRISADGAHRSMEIAETTRERFQDLASKAEAVLREPSPAATVVHDFAREVIAMRDHVSQGNQEIVTAQSWQDLSGQRIKKVITFIQSVRKTLLELVSLTGTMAKGESAPKVVTVQSQEEIDAMLRDMGL